ncbi:hypothetical protein DPMN_183908 [Dreissena polymorpha]|uniref:Uncharacterized protein n=1 Tax=Dreissena polymorpha TaxID=45954 RepID=A0A9D4I5W6_DREPO|nr:hypothetical protein DPMN_183908 [Dreissena polymorpha]
MNAFGISFFIKPDANKPVVVFRHFRHYITRFPALSVLNQFVVATDIFTETFTGGDQLHVTDAFAQTPNIDPSDRRYFNKIIVAANFLTIKNNHTLIIQFSADPAATFANTLYSRSTASSISATTGSRSTTPSPSFGSYRPLPIFLIGTPLAPLKIELPLSTFRKSPSGIVWFTIWEILVLGAPVSVADINCTPLTPHSQTDHRRAHTATH